MVFEFQIARPKLEGLLHNRLLAQRPCVSAPFLYNEEEFYVARITLGATSVFVDSGTRPALLYQFLSNDLTYLVTSIEVPPLRMKQEAVAHVVSRASLESANQNPTALLAVPFDVIFDLAIAFDDDHVPQLCASVQSVQNLNLPDPATQQQVESFLQSSVVSCAEVNLDSISALTATALPPVINAGIAALGNGQRITIRLDTHTFRLDNELFWSAFYAGAFPLIESAHDWAVLVPKEVILPGMAQQVNTALAEATDVFTLAAGPDVAWMSSGSEPHATITVSGELIDACIDIDVDVDVTLDISFSVPQPGKLRATLTMTWDANNGELFVCEFVAATVWPVVGATMLSEEKIDWWMFLGGLAFGPLILFNVLVGYLSSDEPASHIPSFPGWTEASDTERFQDLDFPTSLGSLAGGITLIDASATGTGLILAGSMATTPAAIQDLSASVVGFAPWVLQNPCGQSRWETQAHIILGPTTAPNQPLVPIRVCHWERIDDPLDQYEDFERVGELQFTFRVRLPLKPGFNYPDPDVAVPPGYTVAYPLKVLIVTTDGARFITIPPPPPPPPAFSQFEEIAFQLWKVIHCTKFDSMWNHVHKLLPEALIDPPPEQEVSLLWAVTVRGMHERDAFVLRDAQGLELVRAFADARGFARTTAVVDDLGHAGITIERAGMAAPASEIQMHAAETRLADTQLTESVSVKRTLLVRAATIALDGPIECLSFERFRGAATVFVATHAGLAAYSLAAPWRPRRLALRARATGSEAVPRWVTKRLTKETRCGGESVRDAIRHGNFTYLVREHSIEVIDEHGCSLSEVLLTGADSIAVAGDLIVVGTADGLTVFETTDTHELRLADAIQSPDARGVARAKLPFVRRAVYVRGRGRGGRVLDLHDPKRPVEVSRHSRQPWYVDGGQFGCLLVRTAHDNRHLLVYRMAASQIGFERPPTLEEIRAAHDGRQLR